MGNFLSCCNKQSVLTLAAQILLSKLGTDFTLDEWNGARKDGEIETALQTMKSYATDLSTMTEKSMPKSLDRVVFLCINTYTDPSTTLGVGPMNDGINVADSMAKYGTWKLYFLHNPKKDSYLQWLDYFLKNTKTELITYYTGHGTQLDSNDKEENDSKDEAYYFEDGTVSDNVLNQHLQNKTNNNLRCLLLSDCCHSGTIWDLNKSGTPPNIMSISAAKDSQTAKQTEVEGDEQGIFTFYFFKFLEQDQTLTANQLQTKMLQYLSKFDQNFTKQQTTDSMADEPVLQ